MQAYSIKEASNLEFIDKLKNAAQRGVSADERLEQKVSFVYGSIQSDSMTKEKIRETLKSRNA